MASSSKVFSHFLSSLLRFYAIPLHFFLLLCFFLSFFHSTTSSEYSRSLVMLFGNVDDDVGDDSEWCDCCIEIVGRRVLKFKIGFY